MILYLIISLYFYLLSAIASGKDNNFKKFQNSEFISIVNVLAFCAGDFQLKW